MRPSQPSPISKPVGSCFSSWLLLLYCASPRAHYTLRGLRPDLTRDFAAAHDQSIQQCLAQLLQLPALPESSAHRARLALSLGGLGPRSAFHHTAAAFWASWQDAANTLHSKTLDLFQEVERHLQAPAPTLPTIQCISHVQTFLNNIGFATPPWPERTPPPAPVQLPEAPRDLPRGWQQAASAAIDQAYSTAVRSALDPALQALLDSQSGPFAATAFTLLPTSPDLVFESAPFRVCCCGDSGSPCHTCQPDADATACWIHWGTTGQHALAPELCGQGGVAMERAMARICREAGASVCTNVLLRDLNTHSSRTDERRIEVIANGLPLWNGSQLAIDTTLVSPPTSQAEPRRHQQTTAGAALRIARRAKERTYPELVGGGRARLVVVAIELGGRWSSEAATLLRLLSRHKTQSISILLRPAARHAWISRWAAHLSAAAMRSFACSLLHLPASTTTNILTALNHLRVTCSHNTPTATPAPAFSPPPPYISGFCISGDWPV